MFAGCCGGHAAPRAADDAERLVLPGVGAAPQVTPEPCGPRWPAEPRAPAPVSPRKQREGWWSQAWQLAHVFLHGLPAGVGALAVLLLAGAGPLRRSDLVGGVLGMGLLVVAQSLVHEVMPAESAAAGHGRPQKQAIDEDMSPPLPSECPSNSENREDQERRAVEEVLQRTRRLLTEGCSPRVDPSCCRRFLRGWKGDIDGAVAGIQRCARWRSTVRPAAISAEDVTAELATGKGYVHGVDRHGQAVMWAFAGRHDKRSRKLQESVHLILYCLEKAIRLGEERGVEKICLVFDLSGFSSASMDYELVRELFVLLANYYPERLGQVLLWSAPSVFSAFWRVIRPYIDPATAAKVQFVARGDLGEHIDVGEHPAELRGRAGMARQG